MKLFPSSSLLLLTLGGVASVVAGKALPTVHVSAGDKDTIEVACGNPRAPDSATVAKLFNVHTDEQANRLRFKLARAVAQACAAGTPHILVDRRDSGRQLSWTAVN